MKRPTSPSSGAQQIADGADQLADGTELEYTLRTADPAVYHLFTADLERRLRSARVQVPATRSDRKLSRYRAYGSASATEASTRTYSLPTGEVEVAIRASGAGSHGYLRYHVESAIAYTHALDVDVERAAALSAILLGIAAIAVLVGQPFLAAPAIGAGAAIGVPAGLNRLAARGRPISITRWDVPDPN